MGWEGWTQRYADVSNPPIPWRLLAWPEGHFERFGGC